MRMYLTFLDHFLECAVRTLCCEPSHAICTLTIVIFTDKHKMQKSFACALFLVICQLVLKGTSAAVCLVWVPPRATSMQFNT